MAQGLQVWDADGNLVFDATTKVTRIIDSISIGKTNGSQSFPSVNNTIVAWPTQYSGGVSPSITVSGNTVSWDFGNTPSTLRSNCVVLVMGY